MRPSVERMAVAMECKLREHDGQRDGWGPRDRTSGFRLLERLDAEIEELRTEVLEGDPWGIRAEAADVANYAMMLAEHFEGKGGDRGAT